MRRNLLHHRDAKTQRVAKNLAPESKEFGCGPQTLHLISPSDRIYDQVCGSETCFHERSTEILILDFADKRTFGDDLSPGRKMDVSNWIVVAVSFRSNDPSLELQITQFLQGQTTETMKARAFISTPRFHQVKLSAYFAPQDDVVGAKFVFPRRIQGVPVVIPEDQVVSFELDVPSFEQDLRANFFVTRMVVKGEPLL